MKKAKQDARYIGKLQSYWRKKWRKRKPKKVIKKQETLRPPLLIIAEAIIRVLFEYYNTLLTYYSIMIIMHAICLAMGNRTFFYTTRFKLNSCPLAHC